jgi:YVTN family beta-propeller protein
VTESPRATRHALRAPLVLLLAVALFLGSVAGLSARDAQTKLIPQPGRRISPAGTLVKDAATRLPAVGALPTALVRSPDAGGPDGLGRYLIAVNGGFGVQFSAAQPRPLQSLAVIDLTVAPAPAVIQNVYFQAPQSALAAVFDVKSQPDGTYALYVAGGVENKIWTLRFTPNATRPISPGQSDGAAPLDAPFIDVSGFAEAAPTPRYNGNQAPVYPTGVAVGDGGGALYVANNLADSLGVVFDLTGERKLKKVSLRRGDDPQRFVYPHSVAALNEDSGKTRKVYVSCWGDESVAVIDPSSLAVNFIAVARHPTAMIFNREKTRLYVVNSNADCVSVIDTKTDREVERVNVRLAETAPLGASPESLDLSRNEATLYVANAHSNSVAVVALSAAARGMTDESASAEREERREARREKSERTAVKKENADRDDEMPAHSVVKGFIPTGFYPSAVATAGDALYVGNGKGGGFENSSVVATDTGLAPNAPNDRFPAGDRGRTALGGQYSVALVAGTISRIPLPSEAELAEHTQRVLYNAGLTGQRKSALFRGASPIRHVLYVIKENRTYDAIFGDLEKSGDGAPADGDPSLAIFGAGAAAAAPDGTPQNVTPNHRALALRFGLFDRFFVNSEASPDGHNWSTAAFSSDYVDKAYRWNYSRRGRSYDYEGFNRLPNFEPSVSAPAMFRKSVDAAFLSDYLRRYVPYLHGGRDVAEPETLYLWDAAARAGLTYRNYGEFIGTISEAEIKSVNANRRKPYPDLTPTVAAVPTKKSLEGRHSLTFRNFDMETPDAMTTESYAEAKRSGADAAISPTHADARFRGVSRLGEWLEEFSGCVKERETTGVDRLPNLSVLRFSNDHTAGLTPGMPTPQFFVADNDYAVGRLVEAVSKSPYWKDTAIVIVEDDAQDGPDHVDCHRSVALIVSAYNRPGRLVREYHTTVSVIRTLELLLGMSPMNALDANAIPADIFQEAPDLRPFLAQLPDLSPKNLLVESSRSVQSAEWIQKTRSLNLEHADMADARVLNEIIWRSVRARPMPRVSRLPAFDALCAGIVREERDGDE